MLSRPRFPACQHLGFELSGARMPLKGLFNRLEHVRNLGFALDSACGAPCSCQYIMGNSSASAHWVHLGVIASCAVLTYRLPPTIDQGRDAGKLLADLV